MGGEGEGPLEPTPKFASVIAMGDNQVCFDEVLATIMGMDVNKIPTLNQIKKINTSFESLNVEQEPDVISNDFDWNNMKIENFQKDKSLQFKPTDGWKGHIELE